ncbi:hypothetical protein PRIPAC_87767, partial [Pristionchus pacificus]|uniref:EGF-like domain-containing protein n=1 Tax=Pristionchus pacificus TaxID=54126 RepID=A0A2A6B8R4_PRIPA
AEKGFYKPVSAPATRTRLLAPFKTSPDCAEVKAYPPFPPLPTADCRAIFHDPTSQLCALLGESVYSACTVNKTEYVLGLCEDVMCSNRGTCKDFNQGPGNGDQNVNETATYCECATGWQGVKCDEEIEPDEPNECDDDPCNKEKNLGHLCIRQKALTTRLGHTCICARGRMFSPKYGYCTMMG